MSSFQCPYCPSPNTGVRESVGGTTPFVRYRVCPKCKKSLKTVEVHLERDAEDYLDIVSRMSSEKLIERFLSVLSSQGVKRVLSERLKKKAGVKGKKATNPGDIFT